MTTADHPALFSASDKASLAAQRKYFRLLRLQLLLLIAASLSGSIAQAVSPTIQRPLSVATTVILAVGLVLMLILRAQRYDNVWFDCRAVAESVKTSAWRYMMQVPPYDQADSNADARFVNELAEIIKARPRVHGHLAGLAVGQKQISDSMRGTRSVPIDERKRIYLQERLIDQKTWYERKAQANRSSASRWFWSGITIQVLALALAILQSAFGSAPINPVPILMTLAAAFVAWTQARRHEELTQSYDLAAQELSALEGLYPHVSDPKTFQAFVSHVEDAISREHTLWRARRISSW